MPFDFVPPPEPVEAPKPKTEDVGMGWKLAGLISRLTGAGASGIVGAFPSFITTPAAAAIGGGAEALAEHLEQPTGTPLSPARIGTEATLSAIPLGKVFKAGKTLANVVRGATLAEGGNVARRYAATGNVLPQSGMDAILDAGSTILGGGTGALVGRIPSPKEPLTINPRSIPDTEIPVPVETAPHLLPIKADPASTDGLNHSMYKANRGWNLTAPEHGAIVPIVEKSPQGPIAKQIYGEKGAPKPATALDFALAEQEASGIRSKDQLKDATQEARNLSARDKWGTQVSKEMDQTDRTLVKANEAAIKEDKARTQVQNATDSLSDQGATWTEPSVSESFKQEVDGGNRNVSRRLKVPPPEEGNGGGGVEIPVDDDLNPSGPVGQRRSAPLLNKPTKPSSVGGTKIFYPGTATGKKDALAAAQNRGMNVILDDSGSYKLVPFENKVPSVTPSTETSDKVFRTWAEARGEAKRIGGEVIGDIKKGFRVAPTEVKPFESAKATYSGGEQAGVDTLTNHFDKFGDPFEGKPTPFSPKADGATHQWEPNVEGGQTVGNLEKTVPITPELFDKHLVSKLRPEFNTLEKYQKAFPDNTHIKLTKVGDADWTLMDSPGSLENLSQETANTQRWRKPINPTMADAMATPEAQAAKAKFDTETAQTKNKFLEDAAKARARVVAPIAPTAPPLSEEEKHGVNWLKAEYDNFPHQRDRRGKGINADGSLNEQISLREAGNGSHSDIEQVAGRKATRPEVKAAIEKGLSGTLKNDKERDLFEAVKRVGSAWTKAASEGKPIAGLKVDSSVEGFPHTLEHSPILPPEAGGAIPKAVEQPVLPGAGEVRGVENPTPTFKLPTQSSADFSLDRPATDAVKAADKAAEAAKSPSLMDMIIDNPKPAEDDIMNAVVDNPKPPTPSIKELTQSAKAAAIKYGEMKDLKLAGKASPEEVSMAGRAAQKASKELREAQKASTPVTPEVPPQAEVSNEDLVANLEKMTPEERLAQVKKWQKGETGAINISPMAATRLGTGAAGALTGAAVDKKHRLRGALVGGAIGAGLPIAARTGLRLVNSEITPRDAVKSVTDRLPNIERGSLLSDPRSLFHNSIGGPWGSGFFGGLEHFLKGAVGGTGDVHEGAAIVADSLKFHKWFKGFLESFPEATERINEADYGRAESSGLYDGVVDYLTKNPAIYMTMGDINVRRMLETHGIPEELARRITLTAEPKRLLTKAIANIGKTGDESGHTSVPMQLMFPFKRTAANILESGAERTPILGEIINAFGDPALKIPGKDRLVQQGLGGAVFGGAFAMGLGMPSGTDKQLKVHTLISNLGGQYALLASIGYAMGQAKRQGKPLDATLLASINNGIPLPTTGPILDLIKPFLKAVEGKSLSASDVPASFTPRMLTFLKEFKIGGEAPPRSSFDFVPPQ